VIEAMVNELSDVDLMMRVKRGDREAFSELLRRFRKPLINFLCRFLTNPADAEDLAQEAFIRVFQSAARYEPKASFTTWLYRIATNLALNHVRDHRPHQVVSVDSAEEQDSKQIRLQLPDSRPLAETAMLEQERIRQIRSAIAGLPENQRLALILTKYQERSLKETAEILNCSEVAVKSLIFRAYTTLRERLLTAIEVA
jgi:RNA polymerase sigma-70 factor (ECF subfamily)